MNDFIPGVILDESISRRIVKYFIYKFFKCGILSKTINDNGALRRCRVFSFHRPFSMGPEYFLSVTVFMEEVVKSNCYVSVL